MNKAFDSDWWDNFLEESANMSKPAVFSNCLIKEETHFMRQCILEVIQALAVLRTTQYGFRVYDESGAVFDRDQMQYIYDNPPLSGENVIEWWVRVFNDSKVGMIINQGERFNQALSKLVAEKIGPLLAKTGIPTEGIVFTLFIGNYDNTPIGIHLDLPGKNVIHFHLGPGSKTIYTWDDTKAYVEMAGEKSQNNKDYDTYLKYARKNDFNEGDLFCMPEDTYHVGTQQGFSIGIACWCNNRSKMNFAEQLINMLTSTYLRRIKNVYLRDPVDNLKPDKNALDDTSFLDNTLSYFDFPPGFEKLTFADVLKEMYKDLRYSLYSNCGYRTSPFPIVDDAVFEPGDYLQLQQPYSIKFKESLDKEKLHIFVRGIKFELNNFKCIVDLITEINEGIPVKVERLMEILDKDWDDLVKFHILNLLYKNHGVSKISAN
jgi:hypothetical protein